MKLVFVLVSRVVKLLALAAIVPSYGMQAMAKCDVLMCVTETGTRRTRGHHADGSPRLRQFIRCYGQVARIP